MDTQILNDMGIARCSCTLYKENLNPNIWETKKDQETTMQLNEEKKSYRIIDFTAKEGSMSTLNSSGPNQKCQCDRASKISGRETEEDRMER